MTLRPAPLPCAQEVGQGDKPRESRALGTARGWGQRGAGDSGGRAAGGHPQADPRRAGRGARPWSCEPGRPDLCHTTAFEDNEAPGVAVGARGAGAGTRAGCGVQSPESLSGVPAGRRAARAEPGPAGRKRAAWPRPVFVATPALLGPEPGSGVPTPCPEGGNHTVRVRSAPGLLPTIHRASARLHLTRVQIPALHASP